MDTFFLRKKIMLNLQHISKTYKNSHEEVFALKNVSFEMQKGDFVALTGISGSGKTTLLKIIGGLENPSKGKIFLNNQNLSLLTQSQYTKYRLHNIGVIFQQPHLIPVLCAWENVAFLLEIQGEKTKIAKEKSIFWLEKLGLSDKINAKPHQLSGGQQQRVSIARALSISPKIILADEPTAHLDKDNAQLIIDLLLEINHKHQISILLSTHDTQIVAQTPKSLHLKNGEIVG